VSVSSVPGEGSTFMALVPVRLRVAPAQISASQISQQVPQEGAWVLVIEDDEGTRALYEKYLKGSAFRPVCVASLLAARQVAKAHRPAAVLLDIFLPGEEQQTWRWLSDSKSHDPTLPIIVASDSQDERKALSLGADAYLHKPVARETLLEALDRVVVRGPRGVALIIDDDETARYVIRRSVRQPMKFEEATDGVSGLAMASRVQPGVIFLDLAMPGMAGDEVLERLKSDPATADIPVIVITSQDIDAGLRTRLSGRARAILAKRDISAELLAQALDGIGEVPRLQ
jgi:CheY-like chemotaxis protein